MPPKLAGFGVASHARIFGANGAIGGWNSQPGHKSHSLTIAGLQGRIISITRVVGLAVFQAEVLDGDLFVMGGGLVECYGIARAFKCV